MELQAKLHAYASKHGLSMWKIRDGHKPNPFPIGRKNIGLLHSWEDGRPQLSERLQTVLSMFFENEELKEQLNQ